MERRDFLKYILAAGACVCSGCNIKSKDEAVKDDSFSEQNILEIAKFPICYHCNLNCAYCSHFSPIAPKYEMPVEVFEKDLIRLEKITKGNIRQIALMGGEPLLHKDINKIITILSKHFPSSRKRISTNGILLKDMDEKFFKLCTENNIEIKYSPYTGYKNYPKKEFFQKLKEKYGIIINSTEENVEKFELINLTKEKKDESKNYDLCNKKIGCLQINNGKCAPCSVISNIEIFNDYFREYKIPVYKTDYLDIYKINSIKEIFKYLKTPKTVCKYCNFGCNIKTKPWKLSNKEVDEWYDINKKG